MQLFGRGRDEKPEEFWRKTGEKRGGEVGFLTFATLLGRSGDQPLELPGLLYGVGETLWFEDFERDNWLARIVGSRKQFEKTELSFAKAEVRSVRFVSRSSALRCISGSVAPDKIPEATALGKIISTPIVQIALSNGTSIFFDMILRREFLALFPAEK